MTHILQIGPWHVGPFPTHICAQHWAESHGIDDYRMVTVDDPAEAPAKIARLSNPSARAADQPECPDAQNPWVLHIRG
jgi:hypothetical protein